MDLSSFAQIRWETGAGVSLNAPFPTKIDTTAEGKPLITPILATAFSYFFHPHWGIKTALMYIPKGATYSQKIPQTDTSVAITLNGQVVGEIPTYYTGKVTGKMRLHYLELPLQGVYQFKKLTIAAGPTLSCLLAGYDKGTATITVGDATAPNPLIKSQTYNNFSNIHQLDYGISLGINYQFSQKINFCVYSQRSLRSLYIQNPNQGSKLYATNFLQISVYYSIFNQ